MMRTIAGWQGLVAGVLLALFPGALMAQEREPISPDRPGLGYGASTVPSGAVLIEVGLPALEWDRGAASASRMLSFPALLRVGVGRGVELRLESPLYHFARFEVADSVLATEGLGDLQLGLKLQLAAGTGGAPEVALIPAVLLPVGDAPFTAERAAYSLNAVAAWTLPDETGFTAVAGVEVSAEDAGRHTPSGVLVTVLSRSLSQQVGAYVEGALYPTPEEAAPAYVGAGITYLVNPRLQLDAYVDRGVSASAVDWLLGVGISLGWEALSGATIPFSGIAPRSRTR